MRCHRIWSIDLPVGIQVDWLDQRNCLAVYGCLRVLVVPLHADPESSPSQPAQLLPGHTQGRRGLSRENPPNQHPSLHVRDLSGVHYRHHIVVCPRLERVWCARGHHGRPLRRHHSLQVTPGCSHICSDPRAPLPGKRYGGVQEPLDGLSVVPCADYPHCSDRVPVLSDILRRQVLQRLSAGD